MQYIQGDDSDTAWNREDRLTPDRKKTVFADVREYVSILRELQPPSEDIVASALQNAAYESRVGARFFGLFNHHDFHSLLRKNMRMEDVAPFLGKEVAEARSTLVTTGHKLI